MKTVSCAPVLRSAVSASPPSPRWKRTSSASTWTIPSSVPTSTSDGRFPARSTPRHGSPSTGEESSPRTAPSRPASPTAWKRRLTLTLGKADQETREGAELIASFFSKIGIDLALDIQTFPHFIQSLAKRNTAIFLLSWIADYPDPLNFLQLFASQNASPGPNRVNFSDAQYDALYEEACATTDEQRRRTLCLEMQEIIRSQMPWIFLYHRREIVLLGPHLANFRLHDFPLGMEKHWRYKPGHP